MTMSKTTKTVKIPLPISKVKMTLLDLAELIVTSEMEKQDLQRQLNEIAAAVPKKQPLPAVIRNIRAAALQAHKAIKSHLEFEARCDNADDPVLDDLKSALKSLEVHAL